MGGVGEGEEGGGREVKWRGGEGWSGGDGGRSCAGE